MKVTMDYVVGNTAIQIVNTGKKVKLKVGDKVIQTYGKREIKDMKKYFVMTDILIELYS